jgi:glycosyltransferase involved in cell wall biosynthesis
MCNALLERSVPYSIIPQYNWISRTFSSFWQRVRFIIRTYISLKKTVSLIRKINPLFVFTNTQVPFVSAEAAFKTQCPHVWWIHEFGEEDFGFTIGLGHSQNPYQLIQKWSNLIICNSSAVAKKIKQLTHHQNIKIIYQPVSCNTTNQMATKKGRFLMFGQIAPSKGHLEVIEAMRQCLLDKKKIYKLHIIGPCEDKAYLNNLNIIIEKFKLEKWVTIQEGFFSKEEVLPKYEVLIIASKSEAFGRVIIEACKAGLKVVVRNSGGAPELLNHTNGLLYNNREELVSILCGDTVMPEGSSIMNYDEQIELDKLRKVLTEIKGL